MYKLLPYLIVLAVFLIAMGVLIFLRRKASRYAMSQKHKAELYLKMLKLQIVCNKPALNEGLKKYKHIKRYLSDFDRDVAIVDGVYMALENLRVVPARYNKAATLRFEKLFMEMKKAPKEISDLVWEKMIIINEIGRIKHPLMNKVIFVAQKRDTVLAKLSYAVTVCLLKVSESVLNKKNRKDYVDGYQLAVSQFE